MKILVVDITKAEMDKLEEITDNLGAAVAAFLQQGKRMVKHP